MHYTEKTAPQRGYVQCHDCNDGTVHEANYAGVNQWGELIYTVVCGEFIERYTSEVLISEENAVKWGWVKPPSEVDDNYWENRWTVEEAEDAAKHLVFDSRMGVLR